MSGLNSNWKDMLQEVIELAVEVGIQRHEQEGIYYFVDAEQLKEKEERVQELFNLMRGY